MSSIFIYINISFVFIVEKYVIVWVYYILFIQSTTEVHLGWIQFW